jgi:LysR family hydrogen peroxide-inducible transcriptional activator
MVSFKQLTYALAVDQTRHFNKAAELCSVSQSALSTAITELEKQLGIQIFERDTRKVLVTPLGKEILKKARGIKIQVDDLCLLAQSRKKPLSSSIKIGVIPTIAPYLLPRVLPALHKEYPDCKLRIIEEQSHELIDRVRNGDIDTAILALPYTIKGLLALEFWHEDFYLIAHESDPRSQLTEINSDKLKDAGLMLLADGHCLKDHALAACQFKPNEIDKTFTSASLNTLVQMVAGRMGSTLVPEMALKNLLSISPELKAVHIGEPGPHRILAFIIRPNYTGTKNIELLKTLFSEQLANHRKQ